MTGPLILHIETATDICSVAVSEGDRQLALMESGQERSHATLLNTFIREAVDQAGEHRERCFEILSAFGQQRELRRAIMALEVGQPDRVLAGEAGIAVLRQPRVAAGLAHRPVEPVDRDEG